MLPILFSCKKISVFGHFFQIISLCPASIPHALSLGQLCLNVHQHLKLLFRYDALLLLPGMVFGFPRDNSFQFFFTISCAQSAEPDESLLPCAFDGGVFPRLDLITLLLQSLQKIFVVFGFFPPECCRSRRIDSHDCFLWADKVCASAAPDSFISMTES